MSLYKMNPNNQTVVNWHITEACNYNCQYCYAHWSKKNNREIINNTEKARTLIHAIHQFFSNSSPDKNENRHPIRINIAGGEPLLYRDKVIVALKEIQQLGMGASIITNASLLNKSAIHEIAPLITVLGISLDSVDPETNNIIGRSSNVKKQVDHRETNQLLKLAKSLNPTLKTKINTVVNAANWRENLNPMIEALSPDKWKVFKMLPILNERLTISDDQFGHFVKRHQSHQSIMYAENNSEMTESYIMIDSVGRFFQNHENSNSHDYAYSPEILESGIEAAFNSIHFSSNKFNARYN